MHSSGRDTRHPQSCTCLVDAFRTFPNQDEFSKGCGAPDCPVRSLDSTTVHQFLEVIRAQEAGEEVAGQNQDPKEIPIFRAMARRLKRRRSNRPPD
jgi:hypothetical protein